MINKDLELLAIKVRAGIVGGAGYTGGELLRILVNHPNVEIVFVHSNSNAGNLISDVHTDLFGDTDLQFTGELSDAVDVLFLCVGHGDARKLLDANPIDSRIKIIDLSQDFRLAFNKAEGSKLKAQSSKQGAGSGTVDSEGEALKAESGTWTIGNKSMDSFVYGLPELQRDAIKEAQHVANPGCFATCIQLALLPLAEAGLLTNEVHISAATGSTGAGQSLSATSHFSWRNNNFSVYKAFGHQHLKEITQSLNTLGSPLRKDDLNFIPYRGDFTRGILASVYTESDLTQEEAEQLYINYYATHPFTHVSLRNIDLKQVVNTNKCLLHVEKHGNKLLIVSIIDNLLKGASGQAVQNMNLLFGLDESAGLKLKAAAF